MERGGTAKRRQRGATTAPRRMVGSASGLGASYIGAIYKSTGQRNNAPVYHDDGVLMSRSGRTAEERADSWITEPREAVPVKKLLSGPLRELAGSN